MGAVEEGRRRRLLVEYESVPIDKWGSVAGDDRDDSLGVEWAEY